MNYFKRPLVAALAFFAGAAAGFSGERNCSGDFPDSGEKAAPEERLTDYVNPFVGTSNFGTTNPGAVCPNGMMSVTPFHVTGS